MGSSLLLLNFSGVSLLSSTLGTDTSVAFKSPGFAESREGSSVLFAGSNLTSRLNVLIIDNGEYLIQGHLLALGGALGEEDETVQVGLKAFLIQGK